MFSLLSHKLNVLLSTIKAAKICTRDFHIPQISTIQQAAGCSTETTQGSKKLQGWAAIKTPRSGIPDRVGQVTRSKPFPFYALLRLLACYLIAFKIRPFHLSETTKKACWTTHNKPLSVWTTTILVACQNCCQNLKFFIFFGGGGIR